MRLLYQAYACEKMDDEGRLLLPGYPAQTGTRLLQAGDKIQVELADGTLLHSTVVKTQMLSFADSAASRLRVTPGFYYAIKVPNDFDAPGVELGAKVFLSD